MTNTLVFRIDKKLLQNRPPRLTFAGTLAALCKRIESGEYDAGFVVDILNENLLLPYMIGRSDNYNDISLGHNTNASKIGDLIVSEECIRGTYELCISFLEFVLATVSSPKYQDTTRTMLASVIYILNEIYTSYNIWSYKRSGDCDKIHSLCTQIFHHILKDIKEPANDLQIICIISLSQNQAHKQLLNTIIDGRSNLSKKVRWLDETATSEKTANNTTLLPDEGALDSLKQSLFIFNQLISQSKHCSVSGCPSTPTSIERELFDTTTRPGLLQHLFQYLYQKNEKQTACLAAELIKNIAEKFSMSLMTCLGSEAAKACKFFIESLDGQETSIDIKATILDLLSSCVKHQPGLIELFLNYQNESSEGSKSLEVVMNLLKDCKQKSEHRQLYTYVMKFVLTFWQKNHSAIKQFDQADQFWESVTSPIFEFLDSIVHSESPAAHKLEYKLYSYSFMILAREIFTVSGIVSERKMNSKLDKILKDLAEAHLLSKYSSFIKKTYSRISSSDKFEDFTGILEAWRDFLTSFVEFKPFDIDNSVKRLIVENTLCCVSSELRLGESIVKERITALGDTLLLVWVKWVQENSCEENIFKSVHEILYLVDSIKHYLPFSFLLTLQTTLNLYLVRNRTKLCEYKRSFDLLVPAVQLMQFSLQITEKYINQQPTEALRKIAVETKLCIASIMTLRFVLDVSRGDVKLWISYLQTSLQTDSLVQFLALLMNRRAGSEICFALVELLLCLASIRETADYLNKATLTNQVNMIIVSAYEKPYAHLSQLSATNPISKMTTEHSDKKQVITNSVVGETGLTTTNNTISQMGDTTKIYLDTMNSDRVWLPIYWHVMRLNISMISTLGTDYMTTAVEFLSLHCIRICEILELLRKEPRSINMEEVLQMIYLINLVLKQSRLWERLNKQSFDAISEEIAKTAYTLATSALPPPTAGQPVEGQQHTSFKPRDCLIYARCCYDFCKYTEAERVLFQTKFGDKSGFIQEAAQIYGNDLEIRALHLAALICVKTNRQSDAADFAIKVFETDPKYGKVVKALLNARE